MSKNPPTYGNIQRFALCATGTGSYLDGEEYARFCTEQGEIRQRIAELNYNINNTPTVERLRYSKRAWIQKLEQWKQEHVRLSARYEEISSILYAHEQSRRRIVAKRTDDSVGQALLAAKAKIEQLHEMMGDSDWTDEDRHLCAALKVLARAPSDTSERVDAAVQAIRDMHDKELFQIRQYVAALEATIREQRRQQSKPRDVLRRLYDNRYPEADSFRIAHGVIARIHLTKQDEHDIQAAIGMLPEE